MHHSFDFLPAILHVFGALALLLGTLYLIRWSFHRLNEAQLKKWGTILVVAGIILCLLSVIGARHGYMKGDRMHFKYQLSTGGHPRIMMTDDTTELESLSGDDFDAAFLEMMIPHHQSAIDMAEAAGESAQHEELKNLAAGIIAAQQEEIDQMRAWQKAWGYAK